MARYNCGKATVKFDLVKITEDRKYNFNFIIEVEDNDDFVFIGNDYECPMNWSEEKVAIDMISWSLDTAEEDDLVLYDALEFNEYIGDYDVPLVRKIE